MKPDEHKFAVYTPLFAPVGVPIVLGLIKELLAWRRRRRARRTAQAPARDGDVVIDALAAEPAEVMIDGPEGSGSDRGSEVTKPVELVVVDQNAPPARSLRSRRKVVT